MARKSQSSGPRPSDELHWRETYFIVFPQDKRPSTAEVRRALEKADPRVSIENLAGDAEGRFQSVLVESPEDHAAVEVSFEMGDAVIEQNLEWAKQLQNEASPGRLQMLMTADARLDVVHFERLPADAPAADGSPGDALSPDAPFPLAGDAAGKSSGAATEDRWASDDDAWGEDDFGEDLDDPELEMLDPTCLLIVVETLSALTKGLAFDPASGEVLQ